MTESNTIYIPQGQNVTPDDYATSTQTRGGQRQQPARTPIQRSAHEEENHGTQGQSQRILTLSQLPIVKENMLNASERSINALYKILFQIYLEEDFDLIEKRNEILEFNGFRFIVDSNYDKLDYIELHIALFDLGKILELLGLANEGTREIKTEIIVKNLTNLEALLGTKNNETEQNEKTYLTVDQGKSLTTYVDDHNLIEIEAQSLT